MKNVIAALICAFIIAALVIGAAFSTRVYSLKDSAVTEEKKPLMYINDEPWYNEYLYPMENIFLVDYIPIFMFAKLDGVFIKINSAINDVMISYKNKYLTFKTDKSEMYDAEGGKYNIRTYLLYGGERYVPARVVCDYFGFVYEKSKNGEAVRIYDANVKLTFDEVLKIYNPSIAENVTETTAKNTEKETSEKITEGTTKAEDTKEISECNVYLSLYGSSSNNISEAIKLLNEYNVPAAFFLEQSEIIKNADTIREINVNGYNFGVLFNSGSIPENGNSSDKYKNVISNLTEINDYIYRLQKYKTRLTALTEDYYLRKSYGNDLFSLLTEEGYIVRGYDYYYNYAYRLSAETVTDRFYKLLSGKENVSVAIYLNSNGTDILKYLLEYIDKYPQLHIVEIDESSDDFI